MFEVKTMNGSVVTAKIAGIESTAKTTSVDLDRDQRPAAAASRSAGRSATDEEVVAVVVSGVDRDEAPEQPHHRVAARGATSLVALQRAA